MAQFETIRDLDFSGRDIRVWCFRCARGTVVDSMVWEIFLRKGWPIELARATEHFRCRSCGMVDEVQLFPATRVPLPGRTWTDVVAAYFHHHRSLKKRHLGVVRRERG